MSRATLHQNIFAGLLTLWFVYCVWQARDFTFLAQVFPLAVGAVLVLVSVINLVQENRASERSSEGPQSQPQEQTAGRFLMFGAALLVLYLLIWLIGYPLAMTFFVLLFYRFFAGASWSGSLVSALAGFSFLVLMSHLLSMEWPRGWIQLPWPLG